jgi:Ca2+-binding EF-hand superfamily protein
MAVERSRAERAVEFEEEVKEVFSYYDTDEDGLVTCALLGDMVRALGCAPTEEELREVLTEVNAKRGGFLNFVQFADLVTNRFQTRLGRDDVKDQVKGAFETFRSVYREDTPEGFIGVVDLKSLLTRHCDALPDEVFEEFVHEETVVDRFGRLPTVDVCAALVDPRDQEDM